MTHFPFAYFGSFCTLKAENAFMKSTDNFPIIIGVGQIVDHWSGDDINAAPNPVSIVQKAIARALEDTSKTNIAKHVDCAAFVRSFPDSLPMPYTPFGKVKNFSRAVIAQSDIDPQQVIYSSAGGEQPQVLVSRLSEQLHAGNIELAVIAGGETTGALKLALKKGHQLDWADSADGDVEDDGPKTDFISGYEIRNGLGLPPKTYAAMEQALRARLGMTKSEYRQYTGQILSNLSKVAQTNPYAQFPKFQTPEYLTTQSKSNFPIFEPYLKWHMAQDAVNQAAALVLTTARKAKDLGIDKSKWVYLHGYAQAEDALVSKRPDLSRSDAIESVIKRALEGAKLAPQDITHHDIYSCFSVVTHLGAECLGLDPLQDQLTVTGGLPFFGGAGNNYSTHAIASLVDNLRADPKAYGLVLANGGFMSKEAAGVYSAKAPKKWAPISSGDLQKAIDTRPDIAMLDEDCTAAIEGYCVKHGREGLAGGYIIARNEKGRVLANVKADDMATLQSLVDHDEVVGKSVNIVHRDGQNFLETPVS